MLNKVIVIYFMILQEKCWRINSRTQNNILYEVKSIISTSQVKLNKDWTNSQDISKSTPNNIFCFCFDYFIVTQQMLFTHLWEFFLHFWRANSILTPKVVLSWVQLGAHLGQLCVRTLLMGPSAKDGRSEDLNSNLLVKILNSRPLHLYIHIHVWKYHKKLQ